MMSDGGPIQLVGQGRPTWEVSAEIAERIKALIYEYEGMSVALAIGCLEIAKFEILDEHVAVE